MTSFLLLVVCAVLGMITARNIKGAASFTMPLNWWVLNVALPALVLELLPKLAFDWHLWFLLVSQWLIFAGAWVGFAALGRLFNWSKGRVGALVLTAGLGNTLFIGYPVIEAILGREALPYAVIADQGGAFLSFIVGGAIVAAVYGERDATRQVPLSRFIVQRLIRFPAMYAILLGIIVGAIGGWPKDLDAMLLRLGATLTPLALFSAGLQFRFRVSSDQRGPLALGLAWKLLLGPLIVYAIGVAAGIGSQMLAVGVIQAAMAPMVSAAILADQNQLEPPLANSMLALGILLSVFTLAATAVIF
jgi:predicted permease